MKVQSISGLFKTRLDGIAATAWRPFWINGSMITSHDYNFINVCFRGNAKQRRQFKRAVEKYLNEHPKAHDYEPEPLRDTEVDPYTDDDYADQYCQSNPRAAATWRR